jgi:hypothetical protein
MTGLVYLPFSCIQHPYVSVGKDLEDIKSGVENGVDFFLLSRKTKLFMVGKTN